MYLEQSLKKFLAKGKVFIGHTRDSENEKAFAAMLQNRHYCFKEEKIHGGSWFTHECKLSDYGTEIAPGVQQIDVMALFKALRTY